MYILLIKELIKIKITVSVNKSFEKTVDLEVKAINIFNISQVIKES